ncbi:hypothetical protein SAMN02982989_1133 [Xaviernesmea oryzae]|uniref:Plastocyanin-like domain-containing protein n=1 Tax=Xaviernesmea oryzae TaxID=464029 RepID=A0A1X7FZ67_9HYPH|nr:hypothetical protein [Xaviernesmea oryzae]SMF60887.1 hypothetical protein SAMN02982989_1133 [Xaviernesmea oryzae]
MSFFRSASALLSVISILAGLSFDEVAIAQDASSEAGLTGEMGCTAVHAGVTEGEAIFGRTICADVVAFDQTLVYNRFGSFNPFGMMFALRRDVVPADKPVARRTSDECDSDDGTSTYSGSLEAGQVRLRDCKRPRPVVLRVNVGDMLHLRLTNLLRPAAPNFSGNFCGTSNNPSDASYETLRAAVSQSQDQSQSSHGEVGCLNGNTPASAQDPTDWPASRGLNFAVQGLAAFNPQGGPLNPECLGLTAVAVGRSIDCYYKILREGPHFLASTAAPSGGEGDGGSITHGLFGTIVVEKKGTSWYRSQVSKAAMTAARIDTPAAVDYSKFIDGRPLLNLLQPAGDNAYRLFHNDLNAIIESPASSDQPAHAFREFSVFFHDELKSFVTRNFDELGMFGEGQLAGVRDGFAINYGSSGMGTMLLANRKGIGPAANCAECLYEEFFLTSWANGDPALLEWFSDDPSNVHHSYLNDAVVFRNVHAGPKETHVFHLHAHQWFAGNDNNRGAYLDSQTVGPQQAFSYDISGGGLEIFHRGANGDKGWWETLGSGNRNRTPGDSIFHCHLYPHFAQGMWELWRVHDVLEDGTRKLPDGQWNAGLTLEEEAPAIKAKARPGSVDPKTGRLITVDGAPASRLGTPVPAIVPLPYQALPLAPTYPDGEASLDPATGQVSADPITEIASFPGYPHYIPGAAGHRPPQAPLDIARKLDGNATTDEYLDGGLPRHVLGDGSTRKPDFDVSALPPLSDRKSREEAQKRLMAKALALGDMTMHFEKVDAMLLPYDGTPLEQAAMAFHHNGKLASGTPLTLKTANQATAIYDTTRSGYVAAGEPSSLLFPVNGAPAKPGSPFADPCGAPDALGQLHEAADGKVYYTDANGADHEVYLAASLSEMTTDPTQASPLYIKGKRDPRPGVVYYIDDGQPKEAGSGNLIRETDPMTGAEFTSDPGVIGFRRYEASAVQLDLVTNRAGWHDPQARINVLTANSEGYKTGGGRISPKVSAGEQPFFFRALSGECIEFRHTNELPKDLALDDFQVKTPTDTIGQHIHLVKFDVTASDGSGNGWNYEDGTFAADEIAARICAAKGGEVVGGRIVTNRAAGALDIREREGLCEIKDGVWHVAEKFKDIWRRKIGTDRDLFQTTVQRWFADPILSAVRSPDDSSADRMVDRTLRTVFSHDHFGPSSIQQHGFYTALVIEPSRSRTCDVDDATLEATTCTPRRDDRALRVAAAADVGARKIIKTPKSPSVSLVAGTTSATPDEREAREFALAIADFATLYDPRDSETERDLVARLDSQESDASLHGMTMLACEAKHAADPPRLNSICGSGMIADAGNQSVMYGKPGDVAPAWLAAGRPGDLAAHRLAGDVALAINPAEADKLRSYMIDYRRMAAGYPKDDPRGRLAKPVAPPRRPESISVDHHDPYLFNYRGEPLPLRVGTSSSASSDCSLKDLAHWEGRLQAGVTERCSIDRQKPGDAGDMSNAFASVLNGDPVTPILESKDGDTVQLRLIQGAQEVQHTFTVEDHTLQRNHDQPFPSGMKPLDDITPNTTLVKDCERVPLNAGGVPFSRLGRADQYADWFNKGATTFSVANDRRFWEAYDKRVARCFNAEGRISAQEVGISEHFEFTSAYLYDSNKFGGLTPYLRRFNPIPDLMPPEVEPEVSDTLVHFGSTDALWNGAWGLLRVQKKPGVSPEKRQIGMCDPKAPKVYAAVVAIEARRLRMDGGRTVSAIDRIRYAPALDDPDGLFFAIVDPRKVMNPVPNGHSFMKWAGTPAAWQNIPLDRVRTEIIRTYDRPEPMVLMVKAGDCLKLTVLNALTRQDGYLRDGKGDAHMPPITPLNVDVTWNGGDDEGGVNSSITFNGDGPDGLKPSARLAVSVALPVLNAQSTMPRPIGKSEIAALAAIGSGDTMSMSPIRADWGQITQVEIYAGLAVSQRSADEIQTNALVSLADSYSQAVGEGNDTTLRAIDPDGSMGRLATGINELQQVAIPALRDNIGRISGRPIAIEQPRIPSNHGAQPQIAVPNWINTVGPVVRRLNANQQRELKLNLDQALQAPSERLIPSIVDVRLSPPFTDKVEEEAAKAETRFIPYAFGALPFKSQGDVVGHGAHGLFGAIVSVPKDASALSSRAERIASTGCRPLFRSQPVERPELLQDLPLVLPPRTSPRQFDCYYVIAPTEEKTQPFSVATMEVPRYGANATVDDPSSVHRIRQFTLFWQDGSNLVDRDTKDKHLSAGTDHKLVADCTVCTDSYDWGEKAVSYRSEPFHRRLRTMHGAPMESHYNLNAYDFGLDFFRLRSGERTDPPMQVLRAAAGEEVVIHVVHPGGRARQRAFITIAQDYDDLFPGFGFPRSALLGPGKALTASLTRPLEKGCYLWFDGPMTTRSGGAWGLVDIVATESLNDRNVTSCAARNRR